MKAQRVVEETREVLAILGIEPDRLRLRWISASEGAVFAAEVRAFVDYLSRCRSDGEDRACDEGSGEATSE